MKRTKLSSCIKVLMVVLLAGACQPGTSPPTPTPEPPNRILFIGDSFTFWNGGIDYHTKSLAASANPPLTIETSHVARGGFLLEEHWKLGEALEAIQKGNWDVVVLQEDTLESGYEEEKFYEYMRKFDEEIKNAGAQTVLYMPWEYEAAPGLPMTTEDIAQVYANIGAELDVRVAPVGLAWKQSIQEQPDLKLFDYDDVHPSIGGTYLTVCVLYAIIFGQSPVGLFYLPPADGFLGWDLTEDDAAFLQRIAWETVVDYQAQK